MTATGTLSSESSIHLHLKPHSLLVLHGAWYYVGRLITLLLFDIDKINEMKCMELKSTAVAKIKDSEERNQSDGNGTSVQYIYNRVYLRQVNRECTCVLLLIMKHKQNMNTSHYPEMKLMIAYAKVLVK